MSNNNALKLVSFGTLGVVSNEIFGCVFWLKLHAHSPVITIFHHVAIVAAEKKISKSLVVFFSRPL